jgi:transposase
MRGMNHEQSGMFSYISAERRVPKDHPLRPIRVMVDAALRELAARFDEMYAQNGRPSIAPEKLLRALLLQVFYTVRSERQLMEQLDYNLLFRWFVGLSMDDPVWDVTVFTKNRERLLAGEVAQAFFQQVVTQAQAQGLMSAEHFTVDGTLIEAWAGQKSSRKESKQTPPDDPGNPSVDFHGERCSNATHQSTTDSEAKLAKKGAGKEAKLCYSANALMENRNGLVVNTRLTEADGHAERQSARAMRVSEISCW